VNKRSLCRWLREGNYCWVAASGVFINEPKMLLHFGSSKYCLRNHAVYCFFFFPSALGFFLAKFA
jgi:hypothetical protein